MDPATTGVSVLQEDSVHKRSSLIRWEVVETESDIGESSWDTGNGELSAAKMEVKVAAENKINNNGLLLRGKHHGLLFSDTGKDSQILRWSPPQDKVVGGVDGQGCSWWWSSQLGCSTVSG